MDKTDIQKNIERTLVGDDAGFSEIINFYIKPVYNFVYRICGNAKDSEDITQEIFIKLWKNLKKYKSEKSFNSWLFSIARNTAIDHLRKKKNINFSEFENEEGDNFLFDSVADELPWPDDLAEKAANSKKMDELVAQLPVIYREVIVLRYKNQLTFEEISEAVKRPLNTIKSQHQRALNYLKKSLNASN